MTPPASVPRRSPSRFLASALLLSCALLAGCLPSSQRKNTRALAPSDSTSATLAEGVPVADLETVWTTPLTELAATPTGITWIYPDSSDAQLAVVETQDGAIHLIGSDGAIQDRWEVEGSFPYLAGVTGDTVAVLARGSGRLDWLTEAGVVASLDVPEDATAALVRPGGGAVVRIGGTIFETPAALVVLDADGSETSRYPIRSPWRASGYVRAWGDSVLALSGYRPVADVLATTTEPGTPLDTLALAGFTNPQLVRSFQFMLGEVDEPPLLTSAAAALGDALYVLNLRTERIRVDVYNREGQLQRVLQGPIPTGEDGGNLVLDAYPADLAVRQTAVGPEIAVLLQRPRGLLQSADARVVLFRAGEPAPTSTEPPLDDETSVAP
ncbi:MAG: hypothetical protein AAGI52_18265 [Bacteroidota bacterium]